MANNGTPNDDRNSQDQQLLISWLTVIGMITMHWSPVERSIDQCVHFLYKKCNLKKAKPTRLNGKLDFIKKHVPSTIVESGALEELIVSTKRAVQIRDVLVHGTIDSYDQQKIKIGKINGKSSDHLIEAFTIDQSRLEKSAQALSYLGENWSNIAVALHQYTSQA